MQRAIDRLEPFQRAISKAHLAAAGVSVDALEKKPLIAIANSWNEICPGLFYARRRQHGNRLA